jgi:hemerythrin
MGIEWRDSLAIGVEAIDSQHKELLHRFNGLLVATEAGKGLDELKTLLAFLNEYVIEHFSDEEKLQLKYNYPDYSAHKREHDSFARKIKAVQEEINSEGAERYHVIETNNMLLKWLLNHISKVDIELSKFINVADDK